MFIAQRADQGRNLLGIGLLLRAFLEIRQQIGALSLEAALAHDLEIVLVAVRFDDRLGLLFAIFARLLLGLSQAQTGGYDESSRGEEKGVNSNHVFVLVLGA